MSRENFNKIIKYTRIDQPIRLTRKQNLISIVFGIIGLGLYILNLDDPTVENIFTDYAGVLTANFFGILFASWDYFKDKSAREIPVALEKILKPKSHRNALVVIGALAAAAPYAGMAWESKISWFSSSSLNTSATGGSTAGAWVVNTVMSTIPVREVLADARMRMALFWFLLLPYWGIKRLICEPEKASESHLSRDQLKALVEIDEALNNIPLLSDKQLLDLQTVIQEKNNLDEKQLNDSDHLQEIIDAARPEPTSVPDAEFNIQTPLLLLEEKKADRPACSQAKSFCSKGMIFLGGLALALVMLLSDSLYVKDNSESLFGGMGFGSTMRVIFAWIVTYFTMSIALVLNRNFCSSTLQYGVDEVSGLISCQRNQNFNSRFYKKCSWALKGFSLYLAYFSSKAGENLYGQKISDDGLNATNAIAIKCFNARGMLGVIDDGLLIYSDHYGQPPARAAARAIGFFKLLKERVSMMPGEINNSRMNMISGRLNNSPVTNL